MNEKYLTVSAVTKYIKYKFDTDDNLRFVFIKGEISNFKSHSTGHLYFSVKDETSKINAIMFATSASKLNFNPVDGTKVLITGRISVYEATGNYQIYVDEMIEDGIGNLYIAFEKLKQDLEKEGLFDLEHKLEIPKIPSRVGVITASTGAAVRDIITTIKRRFPPAEVILFPSLVQGDMAASDIVKNIKLGDNYNLDVLIIGRGGGSIEDLWPFNEEKVARAIYDAKTPIISAVGHEIDYTIADFVSDLRAPTPTAAAEIAVPNIIDLENHINSLEIRLKENILKQVNLSKLFLDNIKNSFVLKNPELLYENKKQYLSDLKENLTNSINLKVKDSKVTFSHLIEKLEIVNPMNVIKRGYTLSYQDDKVIKTIKDIDIKKPLKIRFINGSVITTIDKIEKE